jgi:hypothetical protein
MSSTGEGSVVLALLAGGLWGHVVEGATNDAAAARAETIIECTDNDIANTSVTQEVYDCLRSGGEDGEGTFLNHGELDQLHIDPVAGVLQERYDNNISEAESYSKGRVALWALGGPVGISVGTALYMWFED